MFQFFTLKMSVVLKNAGTTVLNLIKEKQLYSNVGASTAFSKLKIFQKFVKFNTSLRSKR